MICSKEKCTGCFTCYSVCPKNAIEMVEDKNGYIYPKINEQECIKCDICKKKCPSINLINLKKPINCYAARTTDIDVLNKSASGGIATIISKKIIENGGIVYGAAYDSKFNVSHIRITKKEELEKIQGSKYVHSYINDTFINIKKDLIADKNVLFIGTPCQVAGLKKYLSKDYKNLYLIDIICHGVPSQRYLKEELQRIKKNKKINSINFRSKKFENFTFCIEDDNKIVFSEDWQKNPYFYTFMKCITYRSNCYNCNYSRIERVSDLTIGDFWGLGKNSKFYSSKSKGVSVILPITEKGMKIIDMARDEIEVEERNIEEAVNGNDQLRHPAKKPKQYDKFKYEFKKTGDFYKAYKKVLWKNYIKQIIKSNYLIKKILKIKEAHKK